MTESVINVLRAYVESNYLPHSNREFLSDDQDLFSSGIMDSAGALELLLFIEERFAITVPDEDFLPENFASLAAAARYINQRKNVAVVKAVRKCVVWDLDNTLWDGVCLEGDVQLRPGVYAVLRTLDERGILHSVASRGERAIAQETLRRFGIDEYFVVPRINWLPKHTNVLAIAADLNVNVDALVFVDDDPFEREQMAFMLPDVLTIKADDLSILPEMEELNPAVVTSDAAHRRHFYRSQEARRIAEKSYSSREEFLAECRMRLVVRYPEPEDIPRVHELMSRTHQLNTTGLILTSEDIVSLLNEQNIPRIDGIASRSIVVGNLVDRFGDYGTVGVAITETDGRCWRLTYFAMSCRILGRGAEQAFLHALLADAQARGYARCEALMRETGRNRSMRALYQMMGLRAEPTGATDTPKVFSVEAGQHRDPPAWIEVQCAFC